MNFVYLQVLQISSVHKLLRVDMFAYGAVEKPVGGSYTPSRHIKLHVPGRDDYAFIADVLREARTEQPRL
jgi:hypothetical protein